ncbi:hypothetical protein BGX26_013017 [Mortierella sp. AD094]|nr:hypothetical protein BGX26_013017 [Mortierella sp. AD094]
MWVDTLLKALGVEVLGTNLGTDLGFELNLVAISADIAVLPDISAYVISIYAILSRFSEPFSSKAGSIVGEVGASYFVTATVPGSDVNGNGWRGTVAITESSTVTRKEEEEDAKDQFKADTNAQIERCTQSMHVEPQGSAVETFLERKANRTTKRRDNVAVIRRRGFPSSSFSTSASSSLILASIQQVKSELKIWAISLFVLTPTVIPRPRSWGSSEKRSRDRSHGPSDKDRDEYEYDIILQRDLDQSNSSISQKVNASGSLGSSQKENTEPWSTSTIARTSSYTSGSAIMRLAKMALDPEAMGSSDSMRQGQGEFAFVVRSSRLPTVRVGLYGASQKRLWTSTGSIDMASMDLLDDMVDE